MAISNVPTPVLHCRHCGAEAPPMARFCPECGETVEAVSFAPDPSHGNDALWPAPDPNKQAEQPVPWQAANEALPGGTHRTAPIGSDLRQQRYVLAGKLVALVAGEGFALAVVLRSISGGLLQTILLQLAHFLAAQVSSQALGLFGFLGNPLQNGADQLVQRVGYPPLPSLWLFATLGMLVIAMLPVVLMLAGEPAVRWKILWFRILRRPAPASAASGAGLTPWTALGDAGADRAANWLRFILPYAGGALVLAFLGAIPATFGLVCWLMAGALALGEQAPAGGPRFRAALPVAYSLAILIGLALALQGLRSWA